MTPAETAPPPTKEVPNELNAQDKELAALVEAACQLEDRLTTVMSKPEEEDVNKGGSPQLNCEVSERINSNSLTIRRTRENIQSILNRLHV